MSLYYVKLSSLRAKRETRAAQREPPRTAAQAEQH